mgnify:CR=1 FL=1
MNNGIIWLKLKISFGYAILVLLSAFIVYQFRQEQMQRHMLRKKEKELVAIHRLAERIYIDLLDLSTHAEIAVTWDDDDLGEYSRKRHGVCDSLQLLKEYVHTPLQKSHIDSLCLLLWNKELLLSKAVHTFKELQDIGGIVQESIPAIVLTARKQAARQKENTASPEAGAGDVPKKKRSFRDIFRRKENKSAYLQQREEAERKRQSLSVPSSTGTTTRMLRSLNERVTREQAERRARLLAQMDSLYAGSMELNGRMNNMISEFERKNNERFTARYRAFVLERDNSYHMVAGLALSVSLLAIMLYTVIHRDLNRRLQYERELEQSDRRNRELLRSRKELMASVAHDLRAPLAAVKGCAELLPSESDVSRRSGYLDNILHSADYMLGLVNTLMEYHRMDEGEVRSNDTLFSLKALFEEIADSHRLIARQKDLAFTVSLSGLDVVVCCDSSHIRQIAGNLLSNALKFTPHGEVRLEAEYLYGELSISVRDTGVGMSAEEKERIFGAFERLDNARNIPGFGLGLAITARLVSEMRGRVEVKSAPGEGSRFSVFLPVPPAGQSAPLEEKVFPACELLGGTRVLVMDDDRIQQGITREMLSEALHEVVPRTFNRVTVDGDTSTNDMCAVLANGMAGNPLIEWKDDGYTVFLKALRQLCQELARAIAGDGEGASRLITCAVREARSEESAERLAKAVVGSPLVKAAMFGADANWGRVLCAMGYSKAPFRPEYVDISFSSAVGAVAVCRGGMGLDFDEEAARSILSQDEVVIDVHLHEGEHEATCWGCDLTYEYVKINGDYRT